MSVQPSNSQTHSASLNRTLEKTRDVAAQVQEASNDLAIVATVLEQELPAEVQVGEVAQAIEHTEQLEKKLAKSAEKLVEANEALALEIAKRDGNGNHTQGA